MTQLACGLHTGDPGAVTSSDVTSVPAAGTDWIVGLEPKSIVLWPE
jgi:hypothetical protein